MGAFAHRTVTGGYALISRLRNASLLALLLIIQDAQSAEYTRSEETAPSSAEEIKTPLDFALEKREETRTILLDDLKKRLENQPPWLRDASLGFNLRSYGFKRVNPDDSINEAFTLGGDVSFRTGKIARIARLGLSYYASYGLYAPEDRGGTGLLGPNQQDLRVLGEAYIELGELDKLEVRLYRQTLNLPFINKDDSRMIPNTHEAYVMGRAGTGRDFIVGHITKFKRKDSEHFIPMSEAAGAPDSNEGVTLAGVKLDLGHDAVLGGFNIYGWDTFNTAYIEGNWADPLMRNHGFKASVQFTDQRSVGGKLAGDFTTNSFGLAMAGSRFGTILTAAYTQTDKGGAISNPWGGQPMYNSMMLENFSRAGEKAARLGLSWSGKNRGRIEWSGFANIVNGWDSIDAATGESLPDATEYDFTIDYQPTTGVARGLWLRLRGAYADFDDGTDRWNVRLTLNYSLDLL
jgi:hypothetical protein